MSAIKETIEKGWFGSIGPISVEYFRGEIANFRDVMCSTSYTIAQKDLAFRAIGIMWMNLDPRDARVTMAEQWWEMTATEWTRRRTFEVR